MVESDSVEVVSAVNRDCVDWSELSFFVAKLEALGSRLGVRSFSKCSRKSNSLAHDLARAAAVHGSFSVLDFPLRPCEGDEEAFWREACFPIWFSSLFTEEVGVSNVCF